MEQKAPAPARPRPKPRNPDRARPKTEAWLEYEPDNDELPGLTPKQAPAPDEKAKWLRAIELMAPKLIDTKTAVYLFEDWNDRSDGRIPACACLAQVGLAIDAQKVERLKRLAIAAAVLKEHGFGIVSIQPR